jgi:hypothetical protein
MITSCFYFGDAALNAFFYVQKLKIKKEESMAFSQHGT